MKVYGARHYIFLGMDSSEEDEDGRPTHRELQNLEDSYAALFTEWAALLMGVVTEARLSKVGLY